MGGVASLAHGGHCRTNVPDAFNGRSVGKVALDFISDESGDFIEYLSLQVHDHAGEDFSVPSFHHLAGD